jgi:ParB family transcriptional regulator, chromosome partitioning protein
LETLLWRNRSDQIRSKIDIKSASFKTLISSIKNKGVLEPILVTPKDDKYLLISGERRYMAAKWLNMELTQTRIVNTVTQKDEILAIQLAENLQREDLNPIDQAKGIVAYIHLKHPYLYASEEAYNRKEYNLDEVLSVLVMYNRRPESVS